MTTEDFELERLNLKKMNPLTIVDYIKNSLDILISLKVEDKLQFERKKLIESNHQYLNQNIIQSYGTYEKVINELKSTLKSEMKNEEDLKFQLENLQIKYENLEKEYNSLLNSNSKLQGNIRSSVSKSKSKDKKTNITNRTSNASNFINQSGQSSEYYNYPQKVSC